MRIYQNCNVFFLKYNNLKEGKKQKTKKNLLFYYFEIFHSYYTIVFDFNLLNCLFQFIVIPTKCLLLTVAILSILY